MHLHLNDIVPYAKKIHTGHLQPGTHPATGCKPLIVYCPINMFTSIGVSFRPALTTVKLRFQKKKENPNASQQLKSSSFII